MDSLRAVFVAALATVAIIPSTLALPTDPEPGPATGGSTFSIPQVRNENFQQQDGLNALLRAYAKYNAPLTPQLQTAVRINSAQKSGKKRGNVSGSVSARPPRDYDYEYITPITIGTPPQKLNVVIDTGSADFWVLSSDTSKTGLSGQPIYRPASSTTSKVQQGQTWSITYGDGSGASGTTYTDVVSLGSPAVRAAAQSVQSAHKVSAGLAADADISGLMGLGMSSGNTVRPARQNTFMDTIKADLKAPLFAADLRTAVGAGADGGAAGKYDFGFVDAGAYEGTMQYVPVNKSSVYWAFSPSGYAVGKAAYVATPWKVIADTGTSLLLLPDAMVKAYYAAVKGAGPDKGAGGWVFPCNEVLPDWTFGIGYYRGVVPGRYMNYHAVNSTHCFGGIQGSDNIGFSIFGDVLLKAQFVVFDLGNLRLGWANKKLSA